MTQPAPPSTYILRDLIDVDLPDHVSWMPQTIGWKLVGLALLAVLIWWSYKTAKKWWFNRYRHEAIRMTEQLQTQDPKFEYKAFVIMKRVMGYVYPEQKALFGETFMDALNAYPTETPLQLDVELGQDWMKALSSQRDALSDAQKNTLKAYMLAWFEQHQVKENL